jgi:hypothetical protein
MMVNGYEERGSLCPNSYLVSLHTLSTLTVAQSGPVSVFYLNPPTSGWIDDSFVLWVGGTLVAHSPNDEEVFAFVLLVERWLCCATLRRHHVFCYA